MKLRRKFLSVLMVIAWSPAMSADYVDVLLATNNSVNGLAVDLAEQYEDFLNAAMADSNMANKKFRVHAYESYSTISTAVSIPSFVWANVASPSVDNALYLRRNGTAVHPDGLMLGFDLVIFVSELWASNACGFAEFDDED